MNGLRKYLKSATQGNSKTKKGRVTKRSRLPVTMNLTETTLEPGSPKTTPFQDVQVAGGRLQKKESQFLSSMGSGLSGDQELDTRQIHLFALENSRMSEFIPQRNGKKCGLNHAHQKRSSKMT